MIRHPWAGLLALPLLLLPTAALAPVSLGPWSSVPLPDRAHFVAFAMTPAQAGRLFGAGAYGGVWRSDDAGDHWVFAGDGLPHDVQFTVVGASPRNADVAFSSGAWGPGFFRTTDGGGSWLAGGLPGAGRVATLLPDAADQNVLWAGTATGADRGVWRSTDLGDTWTGPALPGATVSDLAQHPTETSWLLAATADGISRSTDGGSTWGSVFTGAVVREIDWSMSHPDQVWARPVGAPLVKSTDAGITWTCQGTGAATAIAVSPLDPSVIFADAALAGCGWHGWGYAGSLNRTTDGGSTWSRVLDGPCGNNFSVVPMAALEVDPDAPLRVYAAWSGEGLRRSDAGGASGSFTMHSTGVRMTPTEFVRVGAGNRWYVRSDVASGLLRSSDAGITWAAGNAGGDDIFSLDANPGVVELVHESGVPYPTGSCGTLAPYTYRSSNGGDTWSECGSWNWVAFTGLIVSSPEDGQTVYAWDYGYDIVFGEPGSTAWLWRSDDGWTSAACVAETFLPRDAVVDPRDPMRVLAVGRGPDALRVTTDGGVTWASRSHGLPPRATGVRLRVDPVDPDHLITAFDDAGVFETTDGASSWHPVPLALVDTGERLAALLQRSEGRLAEIVDVDWDVAEGARRVFVATTRGVFVEGYGYIRDGLRSDRLSEIAYSPASGKLLVGTEALGLFSLDIPPLAGGAATARLAGDAPAAAPTATAGTTPGGIVLAPNPFSPATTVSFVVARDGAPVRIEVFDVSGRRRITLVDESRAAGAASVVWDGRDETGGRVPPGVYFFRIDVDGHRESRRVVRIR